MLAVSLNPAVHPLHCPKFFIFLRILVLFNSIVMNYNRNLTSILLGTTFLLLLNTAWGQANTEPKPYGGNLLMKDFVCEEMIYPESAMENNIEGTVKIGLTVMQDAQRVNYRVLESVSPELDQEALRICKLLMFYPAVHSSNYIISDVIVPVKFNIKKYKRNCKKRGFKELTVYEGVIDTSMTVYASKSLKKMPSPIFEDPSMSFGKFIMENLKYPDIAFTQNIEGAVELSFVVETSGRISNIEIIEPLGGGCTEEAIHLLKQIMWKPGIYNNMAVRSFLKANINFSLNDKSGHQYLPNHNNTTM